MLAYNYPLCYYKILLTHRRRIGWKNAFNDVRGYYEDKGG
jgi:hypothetical protein